MNIPLQVAIDTQKLIAQARLEPMAKAEGISTASNITEFYLEAGAKLLYPYWNYLVASTPRKEGGTGTAVNWKSILILNPTNVEAGLPEGTRNAALETTAENFQAPYATIGQDDFTTFEAQAAGKGFDDPRAIMAKNLLYTSILAEERMALYGNFNLQLGTQATPVEGTQFATGGSISDGALEVHVVALTGFGRLASTVVGGLRGQVTVTNVAGNQFTFGGGNGQVSSNLSITMAAGGSTQSVSVSTPSKRGALAYAWYWGATSGAGATLGAITDTNQVLITTPTGTGTQAADDAKVAADFSTNAFAFSGYLTQALGAGQQTPALSESGAFFRSLDGASLTSNGTAGIAEIDDALEKIYDAVKFTPTELWMHPSQLQKITQVLVANGGAPIFRYNLDGQRVTPEQVATGVIAANQTVGEYMNPFGFGGNEILKLRPHPDMPTGTMLFRPTTIPYPTGGLPNPAEMDIRRGWYQVEWPAQERRYESGTYIEEVLKVYFIASFGVFSDVGLA